MGAEGHHRIMVVPASRACVRNGEPRSVAYRQRAGGTSGGLGAFDLLGCCALRLLAPINSTNNQNGKDCLDESAKVACDACCVQSEKII